MFLKPGGMLTGAEIERQIKKGNILIDPYDPRCINPNSYNLKLHPQLLVYDRNTDRLNVIPKSMKKASIDQSRRDNVTSLSCDDIINMMMNFPSIESNYLDPIDMKSINSTIQFNIPKDGYVLQPGVLYIGRTVERTATDKFIPMINGRSSIGRLGIQIHITAGFGDIGFDGTWTLEITAVEPVRIYPYTEICQVCYFTPTGKKAKLYSGRYQKQVNATPSRFYKSKER